MRVRRLANALFLLPLALTLLALFIPKPERHLLPTLNRILFKPMRVVHEPDTPENIVLGTDKLACFDFSDSTLQTEDHLSLDDKSPTKTNSPYDHSIDETSQSHRPWYMRGGKKRPTADCLDALRLFPEDAPMGEDRVIDQLMYTLPSDALQTKTILIRDIYSRPKVEMGQKEFLKNKCPINRCILTYNTSKASIVDAILFKNYREVNITRRPPKQIWILYYLESTDSMKIFQNCPIAMFNWTATYRRDSEIVTPYERWVYYEPKITQKELDRNYAANKTKKVAWFVSNCQAYNERMEYAMELAKYISVDIYGYCGSLDCDPNCWMMLDKDYKFYLSFENSNCKDYITEKFYFNGLQHNVLPVVMGATQEEFAAVAPYKSYVHVDDFASPMVLAAYLHHLDQNDTLYNSYFKWKGTGEFINTYFFCRLCAMLHANDQRKRTARSYDDAWWDY